VLVVDGDHDEAIKGEHTEYIASTIPRAGLLILPNASHFAFLQDPELFNYAIGALYHFGDHFCHNRERPISGLDKSEIRPPKRSARVLSGSTMLGRQIDVIETSRGCTFDWGPVQFCPVASLFDLPPTFISEWYFSITSR
jgi:hypothetical protein